MSVKRRKYDTRTILIVLFVIVVIAAGYILITNLPAEEDWLTPEELLGNKNTYLDGRTIVVRGYYDSNERAIVSTTKNVEKSILPLNYSSVKNATDILRDGVKFDFTGILEAVDTGGSVPPGTVVVFVAEQIKPV